LTKSELLPVEDRIQQLRLNEKNILSIKNDTFLLSSTNQGSKYIEKQRKHSKKWKLCQ